jgi:hypothetical protein
MSIAAEDWDDLSVARRRRGQRQASEGATATESEATATAAPAATSRAAAANAAQQAVIVYADDDGEDDFGYGHGETEKLRLVLSVAGGNLGIWVLAHLGVVVDLIGATFCADLIGLTFAASIGMLLASYLLREWHRDREALICFAGALPLPLTIISLLT